MCESPSVYSRLHGSVVAVPERTAAVLRALAGSLATRSGVQGTATVNDHGLDSAWALYGAVFCARCAVSEDRRGVVQRSRADISYSTGRSVMQRSELK